MNALSRRLDNIEQQVMVNAGQLKSTPIGFVSVDGSLVKTLVNDDGEWVETDKDPKAYFADRLEPMFTRPKRFIVLIGGRGSGKSIGVGDYVTIDMHDNANSWLCLREFQNSIKDSVHGLLKEEYKRIDLDGFSSTDTAIRSNSGAEASFAGISRNPASVKSAFGFGGFWVEEAQTISEESLKILTPTGRNKPVKGLPTKMQEVESEEVDLTQVTMVFCANPGSSEDPFSKRFINPFLEYIERDGIYEDDLHLIIKMNYTDNPWYELSGLDGEREWDYKHLDRALYNHIWLGQFNDSIENGLIKSEWFDACIDAHEKLGFKARGIKKVTHDPSDQGKDPKAISCRNGNVIEQVEERNDLDVNEGMDWAIDVSLDYGADQFEFDIGGMGTGLKRQANDSFKGKHCSVYQFNGASTPDMPESIYQPAMSANIQQEKRNKEIYRNLRAQCYGSLRDRIYLTYRAVVHNEIQDPEKLISFSSNIRHIRKLGAELCRMPIKPTGSGLFELYTKDTMRTKFKLSSPNLADCVMMSERIHVVDDTVEDVSHLHISSVNHW